MVQYTSYGWVWIYSMINILFLMQNDRSMLIKDMLHSGSSSRSRYLFRGPYCSLVLHIMPITFAHMENL